MENADKLKLTLTPTIVYDYYPIECKLITSTKSQIESLYLGQRNRPNITCIDKNNIQTLYQANQISLVNAIHHIPNSDGEILIVHKSLSSPKLLLCYFPFMYNEHSHETDIDRWINYQNTVQFYSNIYIDMGTHTVHSTVVQEYQSFDKQGQECHVLVFNEVISIATNVPKQFQLHAHSSEILNLQSLEKKLNTPAKITRKQNSNTRMIQEGLISEVSKDPEDENVIYSCEYLPVDSDDTIQVLQLPINENSIINPVVDAKMSNVFIYNSIIIFFLISVFIFSPSLYNFITHAINRTSYNTVLLDRIQFITSVNANILGITIITVLCLLSLFFLLYGLTFGNRITTSIGMFLPFFTIFSYISINTSLRLSAS